MKDELVAHLRDLGHDVVDCGTHGPDRVDYPDFGEAVARKVATGEAEMGLCVCGTGIGIAMAANKVPGVRGGHGARRDLGPAYPGAQRRQRDLSGRAASWPRAGQRCSGDLLGGVFEEGRHIPRVAKIDALLPKEEVAP